MLHLFRLISIVVFCVVMNFAHAEMVAAVTNNEAEHVIAETDDTTMEAMDDTQEQSSENDIAAEATPVKNALTSDGKINVNVASTKDLRTIAGITANKARAIIKYRKLHGEFKTLDELA